MNETGRYYSAITKIAWGYIFILVHIKINTMDLLPDFAGYAMMLYSLTLLKDKCKNIMLLRPLAIVLIIWSTISWVQTSFGLQLPLAYVGFIVQIIELYFNFQMLTDLSQLAAEYQSDEKHIDKKLLRRRNIFTALSTVIYISAALPYFMDSLSEYEALAYALMVFGIVQMIVALIIVHTLFELRKLFKTVPYIPSDEEEEEEEEEYTESNENAETDEEKEAPSQEASE